MTDHDMQTDDDQPVELTLQERGAFGALPREREPDRMLEERTVNALRDEELLGAPDVARRSADGPPRRDERGRPWWMSVAAIAAGVALFAGGLSIGQALGARQTADAFQTVFEEGDMRLASQVQRAGSDYVAALAALVEADGGAAVAADTGQALEVALTALWAAANEIVRLAPDDPLTARILQGFEARAEESDDQGVGGQLLVEF